MPCLVWGPSLLFSVRHIEGAPLAGVQLCRSMRQALKGARWVGSSSVVQCIRRLMGQPLYSSAADAGVWGREAMVMAPPPTPDSAVSPCFHGCPAFSTGMSHHSHLPHLPSINFSGVNSSPRPGIAPHSPNSSSQPLCLPGDPRPCTGYVWLQQGPSDSHSI